MDAVWYRSLVRRFLRGGATAGGPRPVAPPLQYPHGRDAAHVVMGSGFDAR
jgi:hypothetical protein